jgi:hypothetical protein
MNWVLKIVIALCCTNRSRNSELRPDEMGISLKVTFGRRSTKVTLFSIFNKALKKPKPLVRSGTLFDVFSARMQLPVLLIQLIQLIQAWILTKPKDQPIWGSWHPWHDNSLRMN